MIEANVSVDTKALDDRAKELQDKVKDAVRRAVEVQADKVLATAQDLCPVGEGLLKSALKKKISASGQRATVRADATIAPHGHLVHFGTAKMPGRPFMYQANDQHRDELKPEIEKQLRDAESGE